MITLHNTDIQLIKAVNGLSSEYSQDHSKSDGLFIDWIPIYSNKPNDLINQTKIVEQFIKLNKKIVVFDRFKSLTKKEVDFLKKHKTVLLEPAVLVRDGFKYHPCWLNIDDIRNASLSIYENKKFDLGYIGDTINKVSDFTKYYLDVPGNADVSIGVGLSNITSSLESSLEEKGIELNPELSYADFKTTILIGSKDDYECGYIDSTFVSCLNNGVIPLLPKEHKWFHCLFDGCLLKKDYIKDISFMVSLYPSAGYGYIMNIIDMIEIHSPNMDVNKAAKNILSYF